MRQQEEGWHIMLNEKQIHRYEGRSFIDLEPAIDVIGTGLLRDFGTCFEQMWQKYNRKIRPIIPSLNRGPSPPPTGIWLSRRYGTASPTVRESSSGRYWTDSSLSPPYSRAVWKRGDVRRQVL